jgi:hypothetical protein
MMDYENKVMVIGTAILLDIDLRARIVHYTRWHGNTAVSAMRIACPERERVIGISFQWSNF